MEKSGKIRLTVLATAAAAIMITAVLWCFFPNSFWGGEKAAPLNVPGKEKISSIKVQNGVDTHYRGGSCY